MRKLPPPPVPLKLQEMLKDYPELIQELQSTLDSYVKNPSRVQSFDRAVWLLEGTLSDFMINAGEQLKVAEASGDSVAIAKAEEKYSLMGRAHFKGRWIGDDGLWDYFQVHKKVFE